MYSADSSWHGGDSPRLRPTAGYRIVPPRRSPHGVSRDAVRHSDRYFLLFPGITPLRRTVHKGTTKIERHHKFAKHLAFGGNGLFRTNDPADQEKAIVYNELVA